MEWMQFIIMFAGIMILFLWNRSEGRADMRKCEELISAIHLEMKDFHGRMCILEERKRKEK